MGGNASVASLIAVVWAFTIALSASSSARRPVASDEDDRMIETRPGGSATEIDAAEKLMPFAPAHQRIYSPQIGASGRRLGHFTGSRVQTLDRGEVVAAAPDERIADPGILYLLRQQDHRIDDLCLLIGAVSDNMATNILLRRLGLADVQRATRDLGFIDSGLRDKVRLNRSQDDPLTLSVGSATELCQLVARLDAGTIHSAAVSEQVRQWLCVNIDLSMVTYAFHLDPLAHTESDHGFELWNKTGTISDARIDVGCVGHSASGRKVGYAVLANWIWGENHREPLLEAMQRLGLEVRRHLENGTHAGAAAPVI